MRKIYEDKPNFGRKGSKNNEMTSILDYFTLLIPLEFISDAMIDNFMTTFCIENRKIRAFMAKLSIKSCLCIVV